jgi:hypothetical protein
MASDPSSLAIITPRGKVVVLAVACALFAALGVVILVLAPTKTLNLIVGVGTLGFFGIGGGTAMVSMWRRSVVLRADATGIRIEGIPVPWADIERISADQTTLGIRLRRYDALLAGPHPLYEAGELRANRKQAGGWDLIWRAKQLDRSPAQAVRDLLALRPA